MTHPMLKCKGADSRGSAAYIFALIIIPLVAVVGFALDTSRQVSIDRHLEYATDMASLSAARAMEDATLSDADIETIAKAAYVQNLKTGFKNAVCAEAQPIVDRANSSVKVTGSCKLPTVFGVSFSGVDEISVSSDATAQVTNTSLELALMLDVSSSMIPARLEAMRDGVRELAEFLLDGTTGARVKISIVPFSNGVNAGSFGNLAMGRTALDDRAGDGVDTVCVIEREEPSPDFLTDAAPRPG